MCICYITRKLVILIRLSVTVWDINSSHVGHVACMGDTKHRLRWC
jgi:hypothetical protein